MNIRKLKLFLTLFLGIIGTALEGQTASNNEICLTPNEYRFYAGALVDAQILKKDTALLKSAIKTLQYAAKKDSVIISKQASVIALSGDKEAIYTQDINLLQDKVDNLNTKVIRNRKIAIVGFGTVTLEALIIAGFIYFR